MPRIHFIKVFSLLILFLSCSDTSDNEVVLEAMPKDKPIGEFLDDWTYRVYPVAPYHNIDIAEFRLWVPENSPDFKAVVILAHSFNSNALGLVSSDEWQAFAEKENLVLCGVRFKGGNYSVANDGSGQALIDGIEQIAIKNGIPEIAELPFLMRGYSAGGNFGYSFSNFKPKKVVGLVSIRGGQIAPSTANIIVPGLILTGALEGDQRNAYLKSIVLEKRRGNGLWSFAVEPGADHFANLNASDELARIFFSFALKKRIELNSNQLKAISEDTGWLGNNAETEVFSFSDYPGNKASASWLINADFANAWLEYQQ